MDTVAAQYEAYPYPARDPAEERRRLVTGSPSQPIEMDHILWAGRRDWSRPLKALVAGGGTGDGLIQLAALLHKARRPYEITYVDLSKAAREVAEARAKVRGLTNIRFVTASLLEAPDLGSFDYIDCCGVLHHLPDPPAGFAALRAACAPGGGMGFMVYAPYGRSGVYPLQEAFGTLLDGLPPKDRISTARKIFEAVPEGHPFKRNPHLADHKAGDAGFYDLLLHSQDRAYDVTSLVDALQQTGWSLAQFATPALYDLAAFAEVPADIDLITRMAVAEKLRGTIKVHVGYAVPADEERKPARGTNLSQVPHLPNVPLAQLAKAVERGKVPPLKLGSEQVRVDLPKRAAPLIALVDGRRDLATIAARAGMDPLSFGPVWGAVEAALAPWGALHYSRLLV